MFSKIWFAEYLSENIYTKIEARSTLLATNIVEDVMYKFA